MVTFWVEGWHLPCYGKEFILSKMAIFNDLTKSEQDNNFVKQTQSQSQSQSQSK